MSVTIALLTCALASARLYVSARRPTRSVAREALVHTMYAALNQKKVGWFILFSTLSNVE